MALTASAFIKWLRSKVGCGYVYGAYGQIITIDFLKQMERMYGTTLGEGYFQKAGNYNKGRCARWLGRTAYDCSGLIKAGRKELTGVWKDLSAQGTYDSCKVKGKLPIILNPGSAVFIYQGNKGKIVHTGVYIGNGLVIESRGVDYGVVITTFSMRAWTHYGIFDWLTYDLIEKDNVIVSGNVREEDVGDASTPKIDDPISNLPNYDPTIAKAFQLGALTGQDYWQSVITGKQVASPQNVKKLMDNYNSLLSK
jgi:hypothetical protein